MVSSISFSSFVFLVLFSLYCVQLGGDVGINYGSKGDNLPSPTRVVDFLTKDLNYSASLIRIFDVNAEVLEALRGTNLVVTVGVPNDEVPNLASSKEAAINWVNHHIKPFVGPNGVRFRYIAVGSELIPGITSSSVLPAMRNLHKALILTGLPNYIQVTTIVAINVLGQSYPPSSGEFAPFVARIMKGISNFLYDIGSPLMINIYPYFSLVLEPDHISLDYALFESKAPVVRDGPYEYFNLFDAMFDAFLAAMVKAVGMEDVRVVVAQTGWPTEDGEHFSSIENAVVYNNNLKNHARGLGKTPRMKDLGLEAYIFDMFNENLQSDPVYRSFGTFYPNFTEVYPLWR
ncbi:hypothetical protein UlMin_009290 [Ulmus minor]